MNFETADAILDITNITGWDLLYATRRVYAAETYKKWRDIPSDYCKYAYPVKMNTMCAELGLQSPYHDYLTINPIDSEEQESYFPAPPLLFRR